MRTSQMSFKWFINQKYIILFILFHKICDTDKTKTREWNLRLVESGWTHHQRKLLFLTYVPAEKSLRNYPFVLLSFIFVLGILEHRLRRLYCTTFQHNFFFILQRYMQRKTLSSMGFYTNRVVSWLYSESCSNTRYTTAIVVTVPNKHLIEWARKRAHFIYTHTENKREVLTRRLCLQQDYSVPPYLTLVKARQNAAINLKSRLAYVFLSSFQLRQTCWCLVSTWFIVFFILTQ
jgi:hypothetical protein